MTIANTTASEGLRARANAALLPVSGVGGFLILPLLWRGNAASLLAVSIYAAVAIVVVRRMHLFHPFERFGSANLVTLVRAGLVALLAAIIVDASLVGQRGHLVFAIAGLVLLLDGIDGWLARRSGLVSRFGARFDMEIDALLILVLSAFAYSAGKAGIWVLLLGLMRYIFVAASYVLPALSADLPQSQRRKLICVLQIVVLTAIALPIVRPPWSDAVAFAAFVALSWSFLVDTRWLLRDRS